MPLPDGREYVIGKGRVFFDKMLPGTKTLTGERFLGNAPEMNDSQDSETLDHFSSTEGINERDASIIIEQNQTMTLTVDNINMENVALWYGGEVENETVVGNTNVTEALVLRRGYSYQLGTNSDTPSGVRKVTDVTISMAGSDPGASGTPVALEGNFEIDMELGRIYVELDAPDITEDTVVTVTYTVEPQVRKTIIGKGEMIYGALRFISNNPHGPQKDHFYPYVKLTANGDYSLITTEWQQMSFSVEVLKRDSATARVYVDGRAN